MDNKFIYLNQLKSGDPVCISVNNVREFYPEQIEDFVEGSVVVLYKGEPWAVRQSTSEIMQKLEYL